MQAMKEWVAGLAAGLALCAHAGEVQVREAIGADMQAAFLRGDYQAIEGRYAAALATSERTPSGLFVADVIRRNIVPDPATESDVPGRDDHWVPMERKLDDWAAHFPQSSLVAVVQSWIYIRHGWAYRGGGYARTVPPEAFRKVEQYGQRAYDVLKEREKTGSQDPYWYVQMMNVARVQGWEPDRFLALVQQASRKFPLNYDIYFTPAIQLLPRWGGSTEAIAGLAAYAVDQTRKVEGESMYARVYWSVAGQLDAELSGPEVNWPRIRAGFEDVIKRYPESWNLNHYASMACDARDVPTTRRVLLRIKGDIEQQAWKGRAHYLRCVEMAGLKKEALR